MISIDVALRVGALDLAAQIEAQGPALALFGPSGVGKTTLLNIIAGLVRPQRARIEINGKLFADTRIGVDLPARRRRIGYVFQEPRLFPHLSVSENLRYGRRFAPRGARLIDSKAVTDLLGLDALLGRRPDSLSGGEAQRVAIGRALLASPDLLLLDEPLSALDDARRDEIIAYIERLRIAFATPMIFVSHRISEVERIADQVATLANGRVVSVIERRAAGGSPSMARGSSD